MTATLFRTVHRKVAFGIAKAISVAICEPQLRLGRRRHDGMCDSCEEPIGRYAQEKLDFPLDDFSPDAPTATEKLRAMMNAEYVRICLECDPPEGADRDGGESA